MTVETVAVKTDKDKGTQNPRGQNPQGITPLAWAKLTDLSEPSNIFYDNCGVEANPDETLVEQAARLKGEEADRRVREYLRSTPDEKSTQAAGNLFQVGQALMVGREYGGARMRVALALTALSVLVAGLAYYADWGSIRRDVAGVFRGAAHALDGKDSVTPTATLWAASPTASATLMSAAPTGTPVAPTLVPTLATEALTPHPTDASTGIELIGNCPLVAQSVLPGGICDGDPKTTPIDAWQAETVLRMLSGDPALAQTDLVQQKIIAARHQALSHFTDPVTGEKLLDGEFVPGSLSEVGLSGPQEFVIDGVKLITTADKRFDGEWARSDNSQVKVGVYLARDFYVQVGGNWVRANSVQFSQVRVEDRPDSFGPDPRVLEGGVWNASTLQNENVFLVAFEDGGKTRLVIVRQACGNFGVVGGKELETPTPGPIPTLTATATATKTPEVQNTPTPPVFVTPTKPVETSTPPAQTSTPVFTPTPKPPTETPFATNTPTPHRETPTSVPSWTPELTNTPRPPTPTLPAPPTPTRENTPTPRPSGTPVPPSQTPVPPTETPIWPTPAPTNTHAPMPTNTYGPPPTLEPSPTRYFGPTGDPNRGSFYHAK